MTDDADLDFSVRTGGVEILHATEGDKYQVRSRYVHTFQGRGKTLAEAYRSYVDSLQDPENWRYVAEIFLPEIAPLDDMADPVTLWIEVWQGFLQAYRRTPPDDSFIGRCYAFANWCLLQNQPDNTQPIDDLLTAAVFGFYRLLPSTEETRTDMPEWFSSQQVENMLEMFALTPQQASALLALWPEKEE